MLAIAEELFDNKTIAKTDCILNKNDLTFRECVPLTSFKIEMEDWNKCSTSARDSGVVLNNRRCAV